jgi:hypothetical protein
MYLQFVRFSAARKAYILRGIRPYARGCGGKLSVLPNVGKFLLLNRGSRDGGVKGVTVSEGK